MRIDPILNRERFENGIAANYLELHRQLFEELHLEDPTRSVPIVTLEDPYAGMSKAEIMDNCVVNRQAGAGLES